MLIHTYYYGDAGFGDTIRSIYAYYIYCKLNDIPYYFYVEDHPFEKCFEGQNIPQIGNITFLIDNGSSVNNNTLKILELVKQKDKNFLLRSNVFEFMPFEKLGSYKKEFLEFLKISSIVKNRIKNLLEEVGIVGDYVSIHARCGDNFMKNVNICCDKRIENPFSEETENKFKILVEHFKKIPILFFSDNEQLKKKFSEKYNVKILNTTIHHTTLNTPNKLDGCIDTVSEFFIIGNSKSVGILSKSGIPYWASYLLDKPLFQVKNNKVVEYDKIEYFKEYHL